MQGTWLERLPPDLLDSIEREVAASIVGRAVRVWLAERQAKRWLPIWTPMMSQPVPSPLDPPRMLFTLKLAVETSRRDLHIAAFGREPPSRRDRRINRRVGWD